jgi:hypothetical protein
MVVAECVADAGGQMPAQVTAGDAVRIVAVRPGGVR